MRRTPFELAAIATAAVPGLTPTAAASAPDDAADFDSALLLDSEGKRWRVRSPRHPEASARLETEFLILRAFAPAIRAELPFLMPTVAGTVRQGALSTFVYAHLAGATRSIEELSAGHDALAKEIGVALAAVHDLPQSIVNNADLPSYTANEFRQRKLNELDQAATTGKIPSALLRRWEHALEDVALWRFNPCVVHGDLHEDNLLIDGDNVTALTGWTELRIGDPADDFAWLVASNEQTFVESVLRHYTSARRDAPDSHLLRRSALLAEFALAQYLVKAIAAGHQEMTAEAESMLKALADDIEQQNALAAEEAAAMAAASVPPPGTPPTQVPPVPPVAPNAAATSTAPSSASTGPASASSAPSGPAVSIAVQSDPTKPAVTVTAIPEAEEPVASADRTEEKPVIPPVTVESLEEDGPSTSSGPASDDVDAKPAAAGEPDDTSTTALKVVDSEYLQEAKDA
ncbi:MULTISPECIES: macrolide 2'-phosphotransferase [Arthrobacter]|uniref:Aminoglycoside phosphotransferase n=1 Tax=Arthrobacter terricola TaxID=2547396 RepID=A0A4R5KFN5_9MICC|nr:MULTISPECIES: macrolide 2'-phosphotransferase [Arthrobacter]MBT8162465.1 phosphotransferase [Arthrobacter sp. GN70]TDF93097.1 aminoglycoside phosphotransferase [Arthrobacter terricola]